MDIKPFKMRHLSVIKAIGCCESNYRKYTYRVKGQGKYWSEDGAEGILRVLTCIKNKELEYSGLAVNLQADSSILVIRKN